MNIRKFKQPIRIRRAIGLEVAFGHPDLLIAFHQLKAVFQAAERRDIFTFPVIEHGIGGEHGHRNKLFAIVPIVFISNPGVDLGQIVFFGAKPQMNCILVVGVGPVQTRPMIDSFEQHAVYLPKMMTARSAHSRDAAWRMGFCSQWLGL
ncbi:hypothetical protein D3C71_1520550 [compost metagenome]